MWAEQALEFITKQKPMEILDIGAGVDLPHATHFAKHGHHVKAVEHLTIYNADLTNITLFEGKFIDMAIDPIYDCVWASHILEHIMDTGVFLDDCYRSLKEGGWLAITVPPAKHQIVGGHVSLWNQGLLLYNCILAGFDCSEAFIWTYGYNISLVVRKKSFELPELHFDSGDIRRLAPYFPMSVDEGFDGTAIQRPPTAEESTCIKL